MAEYVGKQLGRILIELGFLKEAQLEDGLAWQQQKGGLLGEILLATKSISSAHLAQGLALQLGLPFLESIDADEIPEDLLRAIPIAFAKQKRIVLMAYESDGRVRTAVVNPLDYGTQDELRFALSREISVVVASQETVLLAINRAYDRATRHAESAVAQLEESAEEISGDLGEEVVDLLDIDGDDEAPIIRLVNSLLSQALKDRASDIHIEPFETELMVRFRIDGILYEIIKPPKRFQNSIISRVKIMAGLNIAEKRLPQDGRIRIKVAGRDIDIRVSSIPTGYGERIVMRLLVRSSVMLGLESLGFSEENLITMDKLITVPHGIILVTGPTGSGKTSTLYACLSKINKPGLNILTIEDPVEYQLQGIGQVQVNPKIELTFATGLRAFLRQDPDVIMVGEIRDRDTAEIAIQASLTGHVVFSTIHTNDAASAVTRLVDMHVEPFLVASSMLAILAQRLVRTICQNCKEEYTPTAKELEEVGLSPREVKVLYRGAGCKTCQGTGYRGRLGIFELLLIDEDIRQLILSNADSNAIKAKAREKGMRTLREDGALKIKLGITTLEEVARVTRDEEVDIELL